MKLFGDVSDSDKVLSYSLEELEREIDTNKSMSKQLMAKCYVCLAHDWLALYADEEAIRLIERAESIFPDYFTGQIYVHAEQDESYKDIVVRIGDLLLEMAINRIKESAK